MSNEYVKTPAKQHNPDKMEDIDTLIIKILDKARVSNKAKNGNWSKPQVKAIIAGLYDLAKDYGDRLVITDKLLKTMRDNYGAASRKVMELNEIMNTDTVGRRNKGNR